MDDPADGEDEEGEDHWAGIAKSYTDKDEVTDALSSRPKAIHPLPKVPPIVLP